MRFIASCFVVFALSGVALAGAPTNVGVRFTRPANSAGDVNDLHVEFVAGVTCVSASHIATPPAPAGDVSWPSSTVHPDHVDFAGTTVAPNGGHTSYKFGFNPPIDPPPASVSAIIKLAYWTFDGDEVHGATADMTIALVPFE